MSSVNVADWQTPSFADEHLNEYALATDLQVRDNIFIIHSQIDGFSTLRCAMWWSVFPNK